MYQDFHKSGGHTSDNASETLFGLELGKISGVDKIKSNGVHVYTLNVDKAKHHLKGMGKYDQDATCED